MSVWLQAYKTTHTGGIVNSFGYCKKRWSFEKTQNHRDAAGILDCTAVRHCTALDVTARHWTGLRCAALECTALHWTALHWTGPHCHAL